jgi:hypothetical protein
MSWRCRIGWRWGVLAVGLLLGAALTSQGGPCCAPPQPTCLEDLDNLCDGQYRALFLRAPLGKPFDGVHRGKLVYLADKVAPKLKLRLAASSWRGKTACAETGHFINRWARRGDWIESHYVIGPSWLDGKPAVIMEYPPKTPLFSNMHDEIREIAPGLYLGPVIERFPCPKFRGWVALQVECGCPCNKH